ncbi:GNAT family N-acetyltransferase [Pararhodospirillum oryzae]|uniref:N-acetyltransferase n=1 Tax=Pararhodospirillum oryzae TaxID=478448 RepID=A0A512H9L5_9PROT|nr:GNAT family N-acetyltransferase [Pararhodospirillum oryzae]GEO82118.1 N-acetyltransferase [Pararhodospirillum oryzae]
MVQDEGRSPAEGIVLAPGVILRPLTLADAGPLAGLLAEYAGALRHGGPAPDPDPAYAGALLQDPKVELHGAFQADGQMVAFVLFLDIPEAISGRRAGQVDDLYVSEAARGQRLAQKILEAVARLGEARDWIQVRWLVPVENTEARRAYARFAEEAPWVSHVLWLGDPEARW